MKFKFGNPVGAGIPKVFQKISTGISVVFQKSVGIP